MAGVLMEGGEFCRGYFNNRLRFHHGFYCPEYCCGESNNKFCCDDTEQRYVGSDQTELPVYITLNRSSATFWVMVGCVLGFTVLIAVLILLVCCFCCKTDPQELMALAEARRLSTRNPSYIMRSPSDRQRSYTIAVHTGNVLDESLELELQELSSLQASGRPSMASECGTPVLPSPRPTKRTFAWVTPVNPNFLTIPLPGPSGIQPSRSCPDIVMGPK